MKMSTRRAFWQFLMMTRRFNARCKIRLTGVRGGTRKALERGVRCRLRDSHTRDKTLFRKRLREQIRPVIPKSYPARGPDIIGRHRMPLAYLRAMHPTAREFGIQTEMKPGTFRALPSKVAVARQPSRRLRASIRQSAKSAAESFQE
jgi:hypothetical protein